MNTLLAISSNTVCKEMGKDWSVCIRWPGASVDAIDFSKNGL